MSTVSLKGVFNDNKSIMANNHKKANMGKIMKLKKTYTKNSISGSYGRLNTFIVVAIISEKNMTARPFQAIPTSNKFFSL